MDFVVHYTVVHSNDVNLLIREVQNLISQKTSWQPLGGISCLTQPTGNGNLAVTHYYKLW